MIVFVDVDDVCANLVPEWIRLYNRDFNDTLDYNTISTWSIGDFTVPECGDRIYEYLYYPDLYDRIIPVDCSLDGVNLIRECGHRVVFATTSTPVQMERKHTWLKRNGYFDFMGNEKKDYIAVGDKSLLCGDVLIDDCVHNTSVFKGVSILYSRPWNNSNITWNDIVKEGWEQR
jgi:5'(3')-deoxyribonucleotidase